MLSEWHKRCEGNARDRQAAYCDPRKLRGFNLYNVPLTALRQRTRHKTLSISAAKFIAMPA